MGHDSDAPTVDRHWRGKYSELLGQLIIRIAAGYMAELKMAADQAHHAAEMAVQMIQEETGGGGIYIAKGHLWAVTQLHRRIYRRFTGDNHASLAKEFNKSERQIYTIVERIRREEFERRQIKLPGME